MKRIRFVDLTPATAADEAATLDAVRRVVRSGRFLFGPELAALEVELAEGGGVEHAVGVSTGSDALVLGLLALGVGPGDEVIVPAFTAYATAAAVAATGARPVLVDVEPDSPVLDLEAARSACTARTRAVVVVHLYGVVADTARFLTAFEPLGIAVVEDCAQAQGAVLPDGRAVGSAGVFGALSFYPTKNLGALGDAGAVLTGDPELASEVRAWRDQGQRHTRHLHELPARSSRLDDLQAAVLRLRLADLPATVALRRRLSAHYEAGLAGSVPYTGHGPGGAPHLAVVRVADPDATAEHLAAAGIETARHYPRPLGAQPALADARAHPAPNAAAWAATCLSLPLHPALTTDDVDAVVEAVLA